MIINRLVNYLSIKKLLPNMILPIQYKGITIREPKSTDAQKLMDYINPIVDEKVDILLDKPVTLKEEKKHLANNLKLIKEKKKVQLLAEINGRIIGNASIGLKKNKQKHVGVFGISVAKDYRGIGLGKKLMELIIKLAEKRLKGMEIIELGVFKTNKIGIRLYKKMGFKKVARIPNAIKFEGKYIDEYLMQKYLKS
jgi:ribosomal protein S18 acetylase RimI-like enzyme